MHKTRPCHFGARRSHLKRGFWDGASGHFTMLPKRAERKTCNCTLLEKDFVVVQAFLYEQAV